MGDFRIFQTDSNVIYLTCKFDKTNGRKRIISVSQSYCSLYRPCSIGTKRMREGRKIRYTRLRKFRNRNRKMIVAAQIAAVWYATIVAGINLTSPTNAMFTDSVTSTSTFTAGTLGECNSSNEDEKETKKKENTQEQKEESIAPDKEEATAPEEQHPQPKETPKEEESEQETKPYDKNSNNQESPNTTVDETQQQKEESPPDDGTVSDKKEATAPEEQHPQPKETPKEEESEQETKPHDKDSNNQEPTNTTVDEHTTNGK
jgi:predicted ribosomally synthesized peptide with SipW-like signal peptide